MKNTFALHTRHAHTKKKHFEKHAAEVESRTQGSRSRTQKKSEAKDRPSRGQSQECSRPRTKDTAATVLQKKRSSKKFFGQSPIYRHGQNFLLVGSPKPQITCNDVIEIFKRGTFCGAKMSLDGRSEIVAGWHLSRILQRDRAFSNS